MSTKSPCQISWEPVGADSSSDLLNTAKKRQHGVWTRWVEDGWLVEVLSLLFGCASLFALCLVLNHFDGKPVPDLSAILGGVVTLNTIVAIIAAFVQACLLFPVTECLGQLKWQWLQSSDRRLDDLHTFDKASRGFIGAFVLLTRIRWAKLGCFGSLLLISAFTISPFLQQLITVVSQPVTSIDGKEAANVPVLERYEESEQIDNVIYITDSTGPSNWLSTGMRGAVDAGLYAQVDMLAPVAPTCSTGNCTFDTYQSLAICTSFANISSLLVREEYLGEFNSSGDGVNNTYKRVHYHLANQYVIETGSWPSGNNESDVGDYVKATSILSRQSIAFNSSTQALGNAIILASRNPDEAFAFELKFDWCLQTFNTTVERTDSRTEIIKSDENINGSAYHGQDSGLRAYFRTITDGSVTYSSGDIYASSAALQAIFEPLRSMNATGLQTILANIATSTTNYMRQTNSRYDNNTIRYVTGTALKDSTIVIVRWQWIAGPVVFAVLSILFLAAALMRVARSGAHHAWKTNSSAMLHALDPSLQHSLGGLAEPSKLRPSDEGTIVKLVHVSEDIGWRIVASQGHVTRLK